MKILSRSIEKQNKLIKSKKLNQTNLLFQKKIPSNFHLKKFLCQMVLRRLLILAIGLKLKLALVT